MKDSVFIRHKLRHYRMLKDLTQEELAQKTGLNATAISHWETGNRIPTIDNLIILADILKVNLDDLIIE